MSATICSRGLLFAVHRTLEKRVFVTIYRIARAVCAGAALGAFILIALQQPVRAQLAPGVQQSAAQTATVTGTVTRSDGSAVAGADVQLIGLTKLTTKSDLHGTFAFTSVPYGTYRIVAVTSNLGTVSSETIVVKGDIDVAIRYVQQANGLKTIANVTTHGAGANINVTPASIASVTPQDYAFQGNRSWKELLNRIPGVSVSGGLHGGAGEGGVIPDGPLQPIILSIDGALPYETATTLDGMPFFGTSNLNTPGNGTDLSFLPMPAFDTADVVRGPGANAPSIMDSIGGSFVLHAPGRVDKNQFHLSISNDPYGGVFINTEGGWRIGRLSGIVVYDVNDSPGPFGNQNVFPTPNGDNPAAIGGQPLISGGTIATLPANPQFPNAVTGSQNTFLYCCVQNDTQSVQHLGAFGLAYDLTPSIRAQVFYTGLSDDAGTLSQLVPVSFTPGPGYSGSIAPGLYNFVNTHSSGFTQSSRLLEEKITASFGHGVLRLAALQNNTFQHTAFKFGPLTGQYTVFGTACVGSALPNPSCPSGGTFTVYNGSSQPLTFFDLSLENKQWVNNRDLLASYETQIGSSFAAGASYVTSYYNFPLEQHFVFQPFLNIFSAFSDSISQHTKETRVHASGIFDKLTLDGSVYIVSSVYHVPDPSSASFMDSTFSYSAPRLGATWRANSNISIRAAVGGGFALPPIADLVQVPGAGLPPDCSSGTFCTQTLVNSNLQPEKSFGFDIGIDARIHRDTAVSLDLYRTNLFGQFFTSNELNGTFAGLPLFTSECRNLGESRFEGINAAISHDAPRGMYWSASLGLTRGYVVNVPAGFYDVAGTTCDRVTGANCQNTNIVQGINFNGSFQSTVPYANGAAELGYRWSGDTYVDLSPTYYGNNNGYFHPAFIVLDAHVGYGLNKRVSLIGTFRNITGIYGQNYQTLLPTIATPTIAGPEQAPSYGLPYGPRTITVTANFHI